jgi:hypothetical protein
MPAIPIHLILTRWRLRLCFGRIRASAQQLEAVHHSAVGFINRERGLVTVAPARKFSRCDIEDLQGLEEDERASLSAAATAGTPAVR